VAMENKTTQALELGLYNRKRGAACLALDKLHINCIIITRSRLLGVSIASMNLSTSLGTILVANQSLFLPFLFNYYHPNSYEYKEYVHFKARLWHSAPILFQPRMWRPSHSYWYNKRKN
jgi:hypothetical protein